MLIQLTMQRGLVSALCRAGELASTGAIPALLQNSVAAAPHLLQSIASASPLAADSFHSTHRGLCTGIAHHGTQQASQSRILQCAGTQFTVGLAQGRGWASSASLYSSAADGSTDATASRSQDQQGSSAPSQTQAGKQQEDSAATATAAPKQPGQASSKSSSKSEDKASKGSSGEAGAGVPKAAPQASSKQQGKKKAEGQTSKQEKHQKQPRQEEQLDAAALEYRAPRFVSFHDTILLREMQLKLGSSVKSIDSLPRLSSVTLTINAATDTRLNASEVEKRDLFLFMLALEHLSGGAPVSFTRLPTTRSKTAAAGVTCTITGSDAYTFLEKLINVILPNQTSFEGLPLARPLEDLKAAEMGRKHRRKLAKGESPPAPGQGPPQLEQYAIDLKVDNLLLYPDFEANFDLFEPLRSMQVRIVVDQAPSPEVASLYVGGFGLPLAQAKQQ